MTNENMAKETTPHMKLAHTTKQFRNVYEKVIFNWRVLKPYKLLAANSNVMLSMT